MTTNYDRYRRLSDVPLDADAWSEVLSASNADIVFLNYHWINQWWKFFGKDFSLYFLTAEENGRVVGFAPLMIDENRELRFIGDLNSDYLDFVVPPERPDILRGFLKQLMDTRDEWRVIHLRNIPSSSDSGPTLASASRHFGMRMWRNYTVDAPYLVISSNPSLGTQILSKYSIRRAERQLRRAGDLEFRVFTSPDEAQPYWAKFAAQHIERCQKAGRTSTFENPAFLPFIRALFDIDCEGTFTSFSALLLNDRPVAFHFGFISQDRLLWYKPSYDVKLKKGSPGVVLITNLIRFAQMKNLSEVDFTIGAEKFKDRFCSDKRTIHTIRIHHSRWRYTTDRNYWRIRQKLRHFKNWIAR